MVINAVKDVASALGDLINCTKLASGKSINDPSMQGLKESARVSRNFQIYFPLSFSLTLFLLLLRSFF